MGEEGGKGRARSDMSWSDVSMFSSCDFLPPRREDWREEVTDVGVPGFDDGALRVERRDGVPGPLGEDILFFSGFTKKFSLLNVGNASSCFCVNTSSRKI